VIPPKYKELSDPELVALCLQGDGEAWATVIHRYRRLIYSVPAQFRFSQADAADVFQAVCVALVEHLRELKDENRIGSWLITTATRQCLRMRSHKYREPMMEGEADERADSGAGIEEVQMLAERRETIREAVERLPERCRGLIEMLFFSAKEPSYDEIGRILGMPVASIGPTRARCLGKLQNLLRPRGIRQD
jgi:RNA polymerase sigma factor (sigma-70 family)